MSTTFLNPPSVLTERNEISVNASLCLNAPVIPASEIGFPFGSIDPFMLGRNFAPGTRKSTSDRGSLPIISVTALFRYGGLPNDEIFRDILLQLSPLESDLARLAIPDLDSVLGKIEQVCNSEYHSSDAPGPTVCSTAKQILHEVAFILLTIPEATVVEASEGDLLIHWDTATKNVVLICEKSKQLPAIYKETLNGVLPVSSKLTSDASAKTVSEALEWLQSPNP